MPPERPDPTNPREWIRRSRSNLAKARADRNLPEVLYKIFLSNETGEQRIVSALQKVEQ